MSEGPQYYEDLLAKIDELAEQACSDLADKANWAADKLEDAANGVLATLGHLIPGESDAEKAIKKWNEELQPAIQEGIYQVRDEVQKRVEQLAGNPMDLIDYSEAYIGAKATLYQRNTIEQDIEALGFTWDGNAYAAYRTAGTLQNDALLALANNLQEGGRLARAGADQILTLWLDLWESFADYQAEAISVIGSCADVGKALGAWVSTIADAIALIWTTINKLLITLARFWKDQKTVASMNWEVLTAGFDGMPGNKWPMISETTSDTMNDPGNWPQSA